MNKDFWERINRLEERAGKATSGEWLHCFSRGRHESWIIDEQHMDIFREVSSYIENAAFIAAANPAMILEMIAEMRRLEKEADWLAERVVPWLGLDAEQWRKAAQEAVKKND